MHGLGGNTFTDNTWNGGRVGFLHTSATNDTVTRITIRLAETAASVEGGTLTIDNSVIDLGVHRSDRSARAAPTPPRARPSSTPSS